MQGQIKRNYYMPKWMDDALTELSNRTGESKAFHVRRAVEKYLRCKEENKKDSPDSVA